MKTMIHLFLIVLVLLAAAFLLYFLLGLLLSSMKHKKIRETSPSAVCPEPSGSSGSGAERVLCVDDNTDALLWRLRIMKKAQKELLLSTFEMRDDNSGLAVMSALWEAAERGVQVRFLIDGIYGLLDLRNSDVFHALISHPNVQVRFYNPINLFKPWRLSFRLHDKYVIADDFAYLLGGRNTYDFFLGETAGRKNLDRELLVCGTSPSSPGHSMRQLKSYFSSIWNLSTNKEITSKETGVRIRNARAALKKTYEDLQIRYPSAFEEVNFEAETVPADAITLLGGLQKPSPREPVLWSALCELMKNRKNVLIQTPYIICSRAMYEDLRAVCDSSAQVSILINAVENGANPWGCTDYLDQKKNILKTGASVYEFIGAHSVHTKTILIDDNISIVGSYNMDMRSTYLDTELMLVVESKSLHQSLKNAVDQRILQCRQVCPDGSTKDEPNYVPRELPAEKKRFYTLLRILIKPIRYLL